MNDRAPTFMEYIRFWLECYVGLFIFGAIAFGLFSAGHTAFGFLIILLFFTLCVVDCVRLVRREKRGGIVNRVNPHDRATFRGRLGRFILGSTIFLAAVLALVFFGPYILLGLIALIVIAWMVALLAERLGWGADGRLTRYLHRPRLDDSRRRSANGATAVVKGDHWA